MEITGVLAVIAVLGVGFAAYFAKLWLSAKAELAELAARSEANTDLDQKTALMKAEFEALSQRLLNERAKELTSQHNDSLTQILKPLSTELDTFKKRINEVYENETRDRVSLGQLEFFVTLLITLLYFKERISLREAVGLMLLLASLLLLAWVS